VLLGQTLAPGQDLPLIQERASVALHVARSRAYVGEAVDVTLRIELEPRLWREQLIQLFRQRTDVAIRVDTPWARPLDGWQALGPPPGFAGMASAVVDGAVAALRQLAEVAEVARGEGRFAVFELVTRLVPVRAGVLTVPRAELAFAWASAFDEDFLGERVPRDRRDERLATQPLEVTVAELPAAGRPRAFTGLVGPVTVRAALDGPASARVGDGLSLQLTLAGAGDLRPFAAPALLGMAGFHARGVREEAGPGRRAFVYDLVALRSGAHAIAPIAVPFFDPTTARYDVATTAPIEVTVAPAADGTTAIDAAGRPIARGDGAEPPAGDVAVPGPAAPVPGVDVLFDLLPVARAPQRARPDFAGAPPLPPGWLWAGLCAPWLAVPGCWWLRRRDRRREERARRRRRLAAWRAFGLALADRGTDRGTALAEHLAAWLDCAPAAVVGPALRRRLHDAGLDEELAREVDRTIDRLAAARFGGDAAPPDDAWLLELVGRVDRELRARQRRAGAALPHAPAAAPALGLLLAALLPAQQADGPTEAARHFAAGDAARAAALYRQALDEGGFDAAALCFDLGNCAHRLGRPAHSVLWYQRALRVAPRHFEARANLRLVLQQLGLQEAGPRALAGIWLEGLLARLAAVPAGPLLALAAVLQILGWAVLLLRRRRRGTGGVLLAAGLCLAAVAAWGSLDFAGETAVVLRDGARLCAEPHERAGAVASLKAGETVAVLEASPRWARVRRGGDDGWVESPAFERVAVR
jgi:tetratricopeptide (TPR) repeat protein